ncbi:MAG: hypothetical protein GY845_26660 [Planctomycetes bacterium]|nr:hypothetical protein [Planctomycetota bacterium]
MKRKIILLTAVMILLQSGSNLWGLTTTAYEAEMAVKGWLKLDPQPLGAALGGEVMRVETFANEYGEPVYYIVYLEPPGFVIVSGDDLVEPIIGFADEGVYDPSSYSPFGRLVANDLNRRVEAVRNTFRSLTLSSQTTVANTQMKWNYFMSLGEASEGEFGLLAVEPETVSDVRVAPLVKAKWGQMDACGFDCYNYYTPNQYPCGCVATALAQLMKYHQYPTSPNDYDANEADGRRRFWVEVDEVREEEARFLRGGDGNGGPYEWDDMPNVPSCNARQNQRQAVGAICYDAGIASNMRYSEEGSGTTLGEARGALLDVFKYSNAIEGGYDSEDMEKMINPNLDAGNPVFFGISDDQELLERHAILCDGYGYNASTIYHHLNMGWDNMPSELKQMWYLLPDISWDIGLWDPGYDYDMINSCIYNIFTTEKGEIISGRVVDMQGEPVEDAMVSAQGPDGTIYSTVTTSEGIYGLKGLGSDSTYTITVEKTGYNFRLAEASTGRSEDGSTVCGNVWGVDFEHFIDNEVITIGTGTSSLNYPMHTGKQDGRTQVIYRASEIGRSGNIRDLYLDVIKVPSQVLENWTIRMKHTSRSQYGNCALETDGWTVVYQNNEIIYETGWHKFEFHTLFEYNGIDNLMVDISHNSSSSSSHGMCRVSSSGGKRSVNAESDSQHGDPLDWGAGNSPTMSCNSNVPNVKLTLTNESTVFCGDIKLTALDGAAGDNFGYSVSISGDYTIVGAPGLYKNKDRFGSAYIFKREGTSWIQQAKLTIATGTLGGRFGESVSIDGDYAIVGYPCRRGNDSGYVYIYKREGSNWTQVARLYGSVGRQNDRLGASVSISGDYVIAGAVNTDIVDENRFPRRGCAFIFHRTGTSWIEQAVLIDLGSGRDEFGGSVSISGDYAVAASELNHDPYRNLSGAAYVYKREGTSWTEQAKLRASDGSVSDSFGRTISISGDYIIVGAVDSTYIFKRDGTNWTEQTKLTGLEGSEGGPVLIHGDYIIVGAPNDNDDLGGPNYGSAYIFKRVGTDWIQEVKLRAWDGAVNDHFGSSVSIDGYYIIVGAGGDDDMGKDSGSAYIFKRGCSNWPK